MFDLLFGLVVGGSIGYGLRADISIVDMRVVGTGRPELDHTIISFALRASIAAKGELTSP